MQYAPRLVLEHEHTTRKVQVYIVRTKYKHINKNVTNKYNIHLRTTHKNQHMLLTTDI